jgi:2-iminobutanoate/2-iminopropanoate deaminase
MSDVRTKRRIVPTAGFHLTHPKSTPAVQVGNLLFVGGQVARDESGNVIKKGDLAGQFRKAMENLILVLEASGYRLSQVVKMNIYVSEMDQLQSLLDARMTYFDDYAPPTVLLGVARLANPDCLVEVDAIAVSN